MDSDEEETFVSLGTPLELVDEDEPTKKPVSFRELPVKDKKGRQRFHGAFTGGFSAGYFNSVGTETGFTPSTFVSSRNRKSEDEVNKQKRPEDFMDDEDFEEHGIAPRKLVTSEVYGSEERKRKRQNEAKAMTSDSIFGAQSSLLDLIIPERLTVGIKLLRKLGWKEGQGIGQRQKRVKKKKHKKPAVKTYGCALPPSSSEDDDIDSDSESFLKDVTFAPKDVTPLTLEAKDNVHGIGYRGLDPRSALPSSHINLFEDPPISKSGKKGIRGQAFGVGALEDEDDDIYATDHMSNYDMTMEIDDGSEKLYGWTAPGRHSKQQVPVSYIGKVLEGFKLSAKTLKPKKSFAPPQLPRDFRAFHRFTKTLQRSETKSSRNRQKINAVTRGLALGETPVFGSVFDLMSKTDKANIETIKSASTILNKPSRSDSTNLTPTSTNHPPTDTTPVSKPTQSNLHEPARTAPLFQGVGSMFKPFVKDPAKQLRYDKYLSLVKQGRKDAYEDVADRQMTEWDREREKEEFIKSSTLYKPLQGMMASRFTTAKHDDTDATTTTIDLPPDDRGKKDDKVDAAKMKMYGRLTRETFDWHPDRLLCKRFNIPDPYPGSGIVGIPGTKRDKYSLFNFLTFPTQEEPQTEVPAITYTESTSDDSSMQVDNQPKHQEDVNSKSSTSGNKTALTGTKPVSIFSHLVGNSSVKSQMSEKRETTSLGKSNLEQQETPGISEEKKDEEKEKPAVDLFRAIFRNTDSEDSLSSDEEDAAQERGMQSESRVGTIPIQTLEERLSSPTGEKESSINVSSQSKSKFETSPPGGSSQSKSRFESSPPGGSTQITPVPPDFVTIDDEDGYGPALPPVISSKENPSHGSKDLIDLTVDQTDEHRKKKHKQKNKHRDKHKQKHKKQKKTKHKSKHKKKEKKSKLKKKERIRDDSDSEWTSTDSDTDSDNVPSDRDLLNKLKSINGGKRLKASDFM